MSFLIEMCPNKTIGSLCVEFKLTFPYLTKEQVLKRNYEEARTSRTMARAEPQPPPPQVEPNARVTRVLRGLTHEQLALVDVYKSENLIGGKYFDPSVLREFGFEYIVNR